jgi:polyisoprenoid-binding protein YceI
LFFCHGFSISRHNKRNPLSVSPEAVEPLPSTRILAMKLHARRTLAAAGLLVGLTVALAAHAGLKDAGDISVKFLAKGPAGLKIKGTGAALSASEEGGKITFVAPLTDLKTKISMRDEHLQEYLVKHLGKNPTATLVVARSSLKFPEDNKKLQEQTTTGTFYFGGDKVTAANRKTKTVKVTYDVERTGSDYHVDGKTTINLKELDMEPPEYLGVGVDPNIGLKVHLKLRDK